MSMDVRRGKVITPRRQRLIHDYLLKHVWVHRFPGNGRGPPYNQWTDHERCLFIDWEKGFLSHAAEVSQSGAGHRGLSQEA